MMLQGLRFGEEAGARNLVFFRVKWLWLGSFRSFNVFCNTGCSCVRSSMRFLSLSLQIALEWLHECCMVPQLHA